jgi:serine phosphatase RsbU (regulator of sigma subunit)
MFFLLDLKLKSSFFLKSLDAMIIRENASSTSEKILHSIIESLKAFRGSVKQEDDVTLAVVKIVQ